MSLPSALCARITRNALTVMLLTGVVTIALHGEAKALDVGSLASSRAGCEPAQNFAPAAGAPDLGGIAMTKSDAILGGTESALDRIRNQQASLAMPVNRPVWQSDSTSLAAPATCSGSALILGQPLTSPSLAIPSVIPAITPPPAGGSDTFLATQRIAIHTTVFSDNWERVSHASLSHRQALRLIGDEGVEGSNQLQTVNRWVNRNITYQEDRSVWSRNDYWATARETLSRRQGDCEDLAILKYQILVALGVDRRDLYLTLARDLARNADHAVLVVRQGGRYYLLDNSTDAALPANVAYDYRPTISFNSQSAWLHGVVNGSGIRRNGADYLSVNATSRPRVMGLSR